MDTEDEANFKYFVPQTTAGRLIIRNKNCDCGGGLIVHASGGNDRRMSFSIGLSDWDCTMRLWDGINDVVALNPGKIGDQWNIEIPGNGDWAFTSGTAAFSREADGAYDATDSFNLFGKEPGLLAFEAYNYGISHDPPNDHYRFDFEFQKFEEL